MTAPNPDNDPMWFESVYQQAQRQDGTPPWSTMRPRKAFTEWAGRTGLTGRGQTAAVVGCGLGDDAEELARRGFQVTAFDLSPTAVAWCQQRFRDSTVTYQVANLFAPPGSWVQGFDFVLEIFTIQALPIEQRTETIAAVANLVAPGGRVFVYTLGADVAIGRRSGPPWSLTKVELAHFEHVGLTCTHFEELRELGNEPNLRFRVVYARNV